MSFGTLLLRPQDPRKSKQRLSALVLHEIGSVLTPLPRRSNTIRKLPAKAPWNMFRNTHVPHWIKQLALHFFGREKSERIPTSGTCRLPQSPIRESQYSDPQNCTVEVMTKDSKLSGDDIIIAVMGSTGSGKSTFVEIAAGLESDAGHILQSQTNEIRAVRVTCRGSKPTSVVLVDTPSFGDAARSDLEILELVSGWLKSTYEAGLCLSGILYLHRISDNRMAGAPQKNLEVFLKLFGEDAYKKVILVTTMWGFVTPGVGDKRELVLKQKYWEEMISRGSRTLRFEKTRESAWEILNCIIIQGSDGGATEIQKDLVDRKKKLRNTKVGEYLYIVTQRVVAELKVNITCIGGMSKTQRGQLNAAVADMDELDGSYVGWLRRRSRKWLSAR